MTVRTRPLRRAFVAAGLAGGLLAVAACQPHVGAAAYVGSDRITTDQVTTLVTDARKQSNGQTSSSDNAQIPTQVVQLLIEQVAARETARTVGARTPTQAQIDGTIDQATQSGTKVDKSSPYIRLLVATQLQEELIGAKVGGSQVSDAQTALQLGQQQTVQRLVKVGVTLNPRYGKFDPKKGFSNPIDDFVTLPDAKAQTSQSGTTTG